MATIRTITKLEDLNKIRTGEASIIQPKIEIATDISEAYEWDKVDSIGTIYDELTKQEFQIQSERDHLELEQAEAKAAQAFGAWEALSNEYQGANPFKRAFMQINGYQRKFKALEANARTQNTILERKRQNYQNGSGRWDPVTRSFRKLEQ